MTTKINYSENYLREFFKSCDKDGDGIITREEFMNSDLPKDLKTAVGRRKQMLTYDELLFGVSTYQEHNLLKIILNKWIQFIVPPKRPPLKPGCYQHFESQHDVTT